MVNSPAGSPQTAPFPGVDAAELTPAGAVCGSAGASLTVGQVSEAELLQLITPHLPRSPRQVVGNGDDCAVLAAPDGRYVVSTDVLVEGHHFRLDWSTARDIGRRAAAQNLADVAAMGARPVAVVVSLVLPPQTPLAWVRALAQGLGIECAGAGAGVVGGDLSAGESIVIAVTVHGDLEGRAPVVRSGARAGDRVVHVGRLGSSAAGLTLLEAGWVPGAPLAPDHAEDRNGDADAMVEALRCVETFRVPDPPLTDGPSLAQAGARAMMDVSDSLLRDCRRIAEASAVVVDVDLTSGRLAQAVHDLEPVARLLGEGRSKALAWVLTGGEDHGLLAALPAGRDVPDGVSVIGRVLAPGPWRPGTVLVNGAPWSGEFGWDHFAAQC